MALLLLVVVVEGNNTVKGLVKVPLVHSVPPHSSLRPTMGSVPPRSFVSAMGESLAHTRTNFLSNSVEETCTEKL